jgi:hypothetical protein
MSGSHHLSHFGQRTVTALSSGGLWALSRLMMSLDMLNVAGETPSLTLLSNVSFKIICRDLKPVVNMQGHHRTGPSGVCRQEQRGGISAAAESHGTRPLRRWC